ncbi:MAG: hypothetical protein COV66_08360 [Nitrospinae bacterium CG11_big_fil_rev_8_21_14_0_20_45_15]|nr:MAG: hypothetical protein COV66_08360 [Nitrospinae bacterium CG11_big_fil_rev_8_21_14_0_20_45_15]
MNPALVSSAEFIPKTAFCKKPVGFLVPQYLLKRKCLDSAKYSVPHFQFPVTPSQASFNTLLKRSTQ